MRRNQSCHLKIHLFISNSLNGFDAMGLIDIAEHAARLVQIRPCENHLIIPSFQFIHELMIPYPTYICHSTPIILECNHKHRLSAKADLSDLLLLKPATSCSTDKACKALYSTQCRHKAVCTASVPGRSDNKLYYCRFVHLKGCARSLEFFQKTRNGSLYVN